ncbi:MAG: hypothetical protein E5W43_00935 [Mesorhizobium sp.]|nr:MAG: hypothetical protein E5W43_00935 [Mesorhizobium sp.]
MTQNEILQACNELAQCIEGKDEAKAKTLAFALLVEALLCLRAIADNTAAVKIATEMKFEVNER